MSFMYPRIVAISRPVAPSGTGFVGYSGTTPTNETVVLSGVSASIQVKTTSSRERATDLPAAPPSPIVWNVIIPLSENIAVGTIKDRDIVTDDVGDRYQIEAAYWNSLGWSLACIRLEAH